MAVIDEEVKKALADKYPSLWFDREDITQLRRLAQKPWSKEEFWSFYMMRPLSIYVSNWLVARTRITPNAITLWGVICGLVSAVCFMSGTIATFLLGIFFYQLSYFFDCVDGEMARITKKMSPAGIWLDIALNYSLSLTFFAVVYGMLAGVSPSLYSLLLYLTLLKIFAEILVSDGSALAFANSAVSQQTNSLRKKSLLLDFLVFLFMTETGFQFGLLLGTIAWALLGMKWHLILWILYHLAIGCIGAGYKIKLHFKYFI